MNRERILRFNMQMFHLYGLPKDELVRIVKAKRRYSAHYRAAALRHLVVEAPLAVTGGLPFAQRRRRVRAHYGI
jgi:microcystin degradation protein MlrC